MFNDVNNNGVVDNNEILATGAGNGGTLSLTIGSALSAGTHNIKAIQSNTGEASLASSALAVTIDTTAPTISSVDVPADGTYKAGDNLDFTVNFSENTTISSGTRLFLNIGGVYKFADYVSGDGTTSALFRYTVESGLYDNNGISVYTTLDLNGGSGSDVAGNGLNATLKDVGSTENILIESTLPVVSSVDVPTGGTYKAGDDLDFTVNFSESVTITGTPRIALTLDTGGTVYATYHAGSGTDTITFRYTVGDGNYIDTNGITVGALGLNGGTIKASATVQAQETQIRAQLSPRDYTTLAAEIGAKLERIAVREGERFRKGDILITFDCSIQKANMAEARAASLAAEKIVAVNARLLELQTIGKLENEVSRAERDKMRAKEAATAAVVSKCAVAAPFDGRIVEQKVRAQQYVQPGQALLDILDDSVMELEFVVPSKWLVWLKPGHEFKVEIDETGKSYPVNMVRAGARIDPISQTVKITGTIGGQFPELSAGMSGRVLLSPP